MRKFTAILSTGAGNTDAFSTLRLPSEIRQSFARVACRKLLLIDSAQDLHDLKAPPGNRLEALKADRVGQHSIRINDQYRVCFVWRNGDAYQVEIVDYH